ncbi:MAG: cupin domain-containing protein [Thermomicrobiales bacterium]
MSGRIDNLHGFSVVRAGGDGIHFGDYHNAVGINGQTVGATGLSMDLQTIPPAAISPPHIHAGFEVALYILSGTIIHRWGERLEHECSASPGDMIYVSPNLPHQSLNASSDEPVQLIVARTTADGATGNVPYSVRE